MTARRGHVSELVEDEGAELPLPRQGGGRAGRFRAEDEVSLQGGPFGTRVIEIIPEFVEIGGGVVSELIMPQQRLLDLVGTPLRHLGFARKARPILQAAVEDRQRIGAN